VTVSGGIGAGNPWFSTASFARTPHGCQRHRRRTLAATGREGHFLSGVSCGPVGPSPPPGHERSVDQRRCGRCPE
jgi:hypothetical protein